MKILGKTANEIFESIRQQIQSGALANGQPLPTVRVLAEQLSVNRNTVSAAYQRLNAAGIAKTQGRLGTVVSSLTTPSAQEGALSDSHLQDLGSGNPHLASLPNPLLYADPNAYLSKLYGESVIDPQLAAIAEAGFSADGLNNFEVNITHGAVDAIERLLATHLTRGDTIAVEDPCFLSSIHTLKINGFNTASVVLDRYGMLPESLESALASGAQAVLCTPRAHNPTGASFNKSRAKALQAVMKKFPQVMIIEDDHFAPLATSAYFSMIPKQSQRFAVIRSVSKCFGPDLRVALVASDKQTSTLLRTRLTAGTTWVSHILQHLLLQLLSNKSVMKQVTSTKQDYFKKRQQLETALSKQGITSLTPSDGLNCWIPIDKNATDVSYLLAKRGWAVRASHEFSIDEKTQGLRITISSMTAKDAKKFAIDLRDALLAL